MTDGDDNKKPESPEGSSSEAQAGKDLGEREALEQQVEQLQQRVDELEGENKPSKSSAIRTCVLISIFLLVTCFSIHSAMASLMPNALSADSYTSLPKAKKARKELGVAIDFSIERSSAFFIKNPIIILPACLALGWFMGFKQFYFSRKICRSIDRLSKVLFVIFLYSWAWVMLTHAALAGLSVNLIKW